MLKIDSGFKTIPQSLALGFEAIRLSQKYILHIFSSKIGPNFCSVSLNKLTSFFRFFHYSVIVWGKAGEQMW